MGINFDPEAFKTGAAIGGSIAADTIKEKIKRESENADKAIKLSSIKQAAINFGDKAIQSGADPKVIGLFTEGIAAQKDPDIAEKIYTAAITNAASQAKDKQDFQQTLNKERYTSGMLGVTEIIKSLAERGGKFDDGTPITAASLQDFGQKASDRIMQTLGISGQQQAPTEPTTPVGTNLQNQPVAATPSDASSLLNAPIRSKASFKAEEKTASDQASAEKTSKGTFRFMQQFDRSISELKKFDPNFDKVGASGWFSRKTANIAEHLDELPETSALRIQILPMANGMAREIESGKVTDNDRKIYADSFANGIKNPNVTNMRLLSQSIIGLLDKGGNENGAITKQLSVLAKSDTDMFKGVIAQVLEDYPELAKDIYGKDFEVINEN